MLAALRTLTAFCLVLAVGAGSPTQAPTPAPEQGPGQVPEQGEALAPTTIQALESLAGKLALARDQRSQLLPSDTERAAALDAEVQQLSWQFASLAARFNVQEFEAPTQRKFDLQSEIESLLEPVLQAIKDATAEKRDIADIRQRMEILAERKNLAAEALQKATRTRDLLSADSAARAEAEREINQRWTPTIERLDGELLILAAALETKETAQKSLFESLSDESREFVKDSGLTLLLCGIVFFAVLFSMRFLQNLAISRRFKDRAVSVRVIEVLLAALSLVFAVGATLVVPYVREDWVVLTVGIIFLVGAGWVLVRMLPQFFEQIRLVLNIGAVREGERLILDGLPYRVDNLRFYSELSNPDLQGGELRVPIQDLIGQRSRVPGPDEPWFPTRVGDFVVLGDGVYGAVTTQTPEMVVIGDYAAPRTYATPAFLAAKPRNLSRGFAIVSVFGIDYRHQRDATSTIEARLTTALRAGLLAFVPAEQIVAAQVDFERAGSSSLDFEARADFAGEAAVQYLELGRALQSIMVEACTVNGWTIPFPQLTVHQVAGTGPGSQP